MRIAIVGAGGVGGYFGGRLAQSGADVVFIARGEHLQALREDGLHIKSMDDDTHIRLVQATDHPSEVGPVDIVLVAVKSWQLEQVIPLIRPLVGPETGVVPLLNGVEASNLLSSSLGAAHALDGTCYIFAARMGPGLIHHMGMKPSLSFGERDNRVSPRAKELQAEFEAAGITAHIPPDIRAAVWKKFVFIASTSGLGAVTRAPLGGIRSQPETRSLLMHAMLEVVAVAQAHGIDLPEAAAHSAMEQVERVPYDMTTSMQRDIITRKPSELDAQSGAVVRLGNEKRVATPIHAFIHAALLPQEIQARSTSAPTS